MGADAKIDLEKVCPFLLPTAARKRRSPRTLAPGMQNVIEIHRPALPVYQTVIEKTRGLSIRTQALGAAMARANTQPVEGAR